MIVYIIHNYRYVFTARRDIVGLTHLLAFGEDRPAISSDSLFIPIALLSV